MCVMFQKCRLSFTFQREVFFDHLLGEGGGEEGGQDVCITFHRGVLETRHLPQLQVWCHWVLCLVERKLYVVRRVYVVWCVCCVVRLLCGASVVWCVLCDASVI